MASAFTLTFPSYFDEFAGEIEAKGFFADLAIQSHGRIFRPVFYDPIRFAQEYEDHLGAGGAAYSAANIVIIDRVTRANIEAASRELASTDFHTLVPEPDLDSPFREST